MSLVIPQIDLSGLSIEDKKQNEFGALTSNEYRYKTISRQGKPLPDPIEDEPPYHVLFITYLNYLILIIVGHIKDFTGILFNPKNYQDLLEQNGLAPWYNKFESFYIRRMKQKIDDCFARPTCGVPGRLITCIDRDAHDYNSYFSYPGTTSTCLNLSSYNYLGFAQSEGACTQAALEILDYYGVGSGGPRNVIGTTDLHLKTEKTIAKFIGKDDSILFSMGYATNASLFSSLLDKKSLVISDELNHASIRTGVRLSGSTVKTFPHNNMIALEKILREQISQGQPRSHRPWKKIIVAVEGLYSMEGTMANLPALIELRRKYKFNLFVDEAHSIGAIGPSGRGVCDYFGIDPSNVDLLMGTLTKSFGAAGGYIAGSQQIINRLKLNINSQNYAESIPAPVLAQIISSLNIISGDLNPGEGSERLERIAFNSRYLRLGLQRLGFIVYGVDDSPVIPLLLFAPAKMPAFSRMLYQGKISVVVVGYPATPLTSSGVRLGVPASLPKEDMDYLLRHLSELGDKLFLKFSSGIAGGSLDGSPPRWNIEDVLKETPKDCKESKYFIATANN
uniref:serine C-palmitoyltransferase n=1 Tax=Wickerhamomyces ciferrii TaxID=1041607 RepID=Q9UVB9_WICCI|nr:serine palmitoyl Co-A transferase subunit 2 [Wickerhamomyces ciferrii]